MECEQQPSAQLNRIEDKLDRLLKAMALFCEVNMQTAYDDLDISREQEEQLRQAVAILKGE